MKTLADFKRLKVCDVLTMVRNDNAPASPMLNKPRTIIRVSRSYLVLAGESYLYYPASANIKFEGNLIIMDLCGGGNFERVITYKLKE